MFEKRKEKKEQLLADEAQLQVELDRLRAVSIEELAAEVMTRTFGPSELNLPNGEIRSDEIADGLLPESLRVQPIRRLDHTPAGHESDAYWPLKLLVQEGFQVLERCGMVVFVPAQRGDTSISKYRATRLGLDALAQGAVDRVIRGENI